MNESVAFISDFYGQLLLSQPSQDFFLLSAESLLRTRYKTFESEYYLFTYAPSPSDVIYLREHQKKLLGIFTRVFLIDVAQESTAETPIVSAAALAHRLLSEKYHSTLIFQSLRSPAYFVLQAQKSGQHYRQTQIELIDLGSTAEIMKACDTFPSSLMDLMSSAFEDHAKQEIAVQNRYVRAAPTALEAEPAREVLLIYQPSSSRDSALLIKALEVFNQTAPGFKITVANFPKIPFFEQKLSHLAEQLPLTVFPFRSEAELIAYTQKPGVSPILLQTHPLPSCLTAELFSRAKSWQAIQNPVTETLASEYHSNVTWFSLPTQAQAPTPVATLAAPPSAAHTSAARSDLITVCLTTYNRPELLARALQSLQEQNLGAKVIVIDDASTLPGYDAFWASLPRAFPGLDLKLIRNEENLYLGASRNRAAALVQTEYLLFMDDDNIALPHEIRRFHDAIFQSGSDLISCWFQGFTDSEAGQIELKTVQYTVGNFALPGLFTNTYGDANFCVRKSVFESSGGFTDQKGVGFEDWEFLSQIAISGAKMSVIPEVLFLYRQSAASMYSQTSLFENLSRRNQPYEKAMPAPLTGLPGTAVGLFLENQRLRHLLQQKN